MNDEMSRALFCGLGLASLTKDAIQKTVEDLVEQSKVSEEEGRRLASELQRRSKQAQKALKKEVDATVQKLFQNLDLAAIINGRVKNSKPAAKAKKRARSAAKATKKGQRHGASRKTASR